MRYIVIRKKDRKVMEIKINKKEDSKWIFSSQWLTQHL